MKYRKKPVVIDAIQWTGENPVELAQFVGENATVPVKKKSDFDSDYDYDLFAAVIIRTLEGNMYAKVGDWVIRGIKGEFYPCRNDIFAATYEPA